LTTTSPIDSEKSMQQTFESWEYHTDAKMRESSSDTEPFPEYEEPDLAEYQAIIDDICNYGADGSVGGESEDEEIINVRPLNQRPNFRFEPSALSRQLPGFIAEMEAANKTLKESIRSGDLDEHRLEMGEEVEGEYIEMNLGLGVLEEQRETSEEVEAEAEKTVSIEEL
jgi:hypothetical protein